MYTLYDQIEIEPVPPFPPLDVDIIIIINFLLRSKIFQLKIVFYFSLFIRYYTLPV